MTKQRPKGRCYLCGKPIWGAVFDSPEGRRHVECVPGKGGHRYGVAHRDNRARKGL